ncbi:MAG: GDP-mannose 4,6-dehydratase [Patescibacteria group bacterium]
MTIRQAHGKKRLLITGGAGFIGINAAEHFIKKGWFVIILDNYSRIGAKDNIAWLTGNYKGKFEVIVCDITRDLGKLKNAVTRVSAVLHLAGQVAVTTSVENPRDDFERNALGAFNVLEAIRNSKNRPTLLYSSTNKVYGGLEHEAVVEEKSRYSFKSLKFGVDETAPLDFHSPYGCSKGTADQYIRDYARIYDLDTVVLRQSCIYGPHQFGIEDQGWVAWFTIASLMDRPVKIYGNGKQVRDVLFVSDLTNLYDLCLRNIKKVRGEVFNVGGGQKNTMSLIEFMPKLEKITDKKLSWKFGKVRPGDQPIFVADTRKAKKLLGWEPRVNIDAGLDKLAQWVKDNQKVLKKYL